MSEQKPDALELTIRFVCGFMFAGLLGIGFWWRRHLTAINIMPGVYWGITCGVLFGILAMIFGDAAWVRLSDSFDRLSGRRWLD